MVCYGMGNWYGISGYGMMAFNGLGIFVEGLILFTIILVAVLLIKETGR